MRIKVKLLVCSFVLSLIKVTSRRICMNPTPFGLKSCANHCVVLALKVKVKVVQISNTTFLYPT